MLWIAIVVVLGLLVAGLIITYGYRHSMVVLLAVLGVLIAAAVWYIRFGDPEGSGLMQASDLSLQNLEMSRQYRSTYQMTGRLVNTSQDFRLTSVRITITASDCTAGGSGEPECIVVGEDDRLFSVEIPPGQARDLVEQYTFPRFRLQGELRWRHALSEIMAEPQ